MKTRTVVQAQAYTLESIDTQAHTVVGTLCSEDPNRNGELVLLGGLDLSNYLANPVLLWNHSWFRGLNAEPESVIGSALAVEVANGVLRGKFRYAVEENPKAAQAWNLVAGQYLRAFSIGYLVHDSVACWDDSSVIETLPGHARAALEQGLCGYVNTKMELVEVSQVVTGADRRAVIQAVRDGAVTPQFARDVWERSGGQGDLVVPKSWSLGGAAIHSLGSATTAAAQKTTEDEMDELQLKIAALTAKVQALEETVPPAPGTPAQEACKSACQAILVSAQAVADVLGGVSVPGAAAGVEASKQALASIRAASEACSAAADDENCTLCCAAARSGGVAMSMASKAVRMAVEAQLDEEPAEEIPVEIVEEEPAVDTNLQAMVDAEVAVQLARLRDK